MPDAEAECGLSFRFTGPSVWNSAHENSDSCPSSGSPARRPLLLRYALTGTGCPSNASHQSSTRYSSEAAFGVPRLGQRVLHRLGVVLSRLWPMFLETPHGHRGPA